MAATDNAALVVAVLGAGGLASLVTATVKARAEARKVDADSAKTSAEAGQVEAQGEITLGEGYSMLIRNLENRVTTIEAEERECKKDLAAAERRASNAEKVAEAARMEVVVLQDRLTKLEAATSTDRVVKHAGEVLVGLNQKVDELAAAIKEMSGQQ